MMEDPPPRVSACRQDLSNMCMRNFSCTSGDTPAIGCLQPQVASRITGTRRISCRACFDLLHQGQRVEWTSRVLSRCRSLAQAPQDKTGCQCPMRITYLKRITTMRCPAWSISRNCSTLPVLHTAATSSHLTLSGS